MFGTLALWRHDSLHSGGFDLGIFDQVVWNSLRGRLFENSIMIDSSSQLGHHFSPILLALVPLYAVWSDARVLLLIQTFALGIAAFPLYVYARDQLGPALSLCLVVAYFLSPSLQSVHLADFHEIALGLLFLSLAIFFLLRRRYKPLLATVVLSLLTKEEMSFIVAALGVYLWFVQKKRALGAAYLVLGVGWAVATLMFLIPFFRGPAYGTDYFFVNRYAYLGKSVTTAITTAITNPALVMQHLFVPMKEEFVLQLLVPLLFLPLVGFEVFALSLPSWAYLLTGDDPFQNSIRFQYTAPLLPVLFFAAILGIKRLRTWRQAQSGASSRGLVIAAAIGAASLANYFFQSAGPFGAHFDPTRYVTTPHTLTGYELMRKIPQDARIYSDAGFVPHLSHRQGVYEASVEFIPDFHRIDYLFADLTLPVHKDFHVFWDDVLASPQYQTVFDLDGYLVKKRAALHIDQPVRISFDDSITLLGYCVDMARQAQAGKSAQVTLTWRADNAVETRYVTFVHLVDGQNRIWAQDDHEPMNGWLRTDRWSVGDETIDGFTLQLPDDIPPGSYRITAGLYRVNDQKNLIARSTAGEELGDAPVIGELTIVGRAQ